MYALKFTVAKWQLNRRPMYRVQFMTKYNTEIALAAINFVLYGIFWLLDRDGN